MTFVEDYNDLFDITWHTDSSGNKISKKQTNEQHKIVGNIILLNEIPDQFNRVKISNMYELNKGSKINNVNEFVVDYLTGRITFHESKDGVTITVGEYYGRGLIRGFAIRTLLLDKNGNWQSDNLEDLAQEIKQYIDKNRSELNSSIANLQQQININENDIELKYKNHKDGVADKHRAEHIIYSGEVSGQSNTKNAIDNLQQQVRSVVVGGTNVDARVSQALVDSESTTHTTLKGRNDKWEGRIKEIEEDVNAPLYTTVDTYESIISMPENTTNGQVSVSVKGRTLKQELNYNPKTLAEWSGGVVKENNILSVPVSAGNVQAIIKTNLKPSTIYGFLLYKEDDLSSGLRTNAGADRPFEFEYLFIPTPSNKGWKKRILTTKTAFTNNELALYVPGAMINPAKFSNIQVYELPPGSEIENDFNTLSADQLAIKYPYIQGGSAKSTISAMRLKSVGINIFDGNTIKQHLQTADANFTNGILSYRRTNANQYSGVLFKVKLKKGLTYRLNYIDTPIDGAYYKRLLDSNLSFVSWINGKSTFVATEENMYILFTGAEVQASNIIVSNIQIEEGTVVTPYEPYTESTQYVVAKKDNKIVNLRSLPNGVKDEIRVSGGKAEWIKRVKDVVFDGTENWVNGEVITIGAFEVYRASLANYVTSNNLPKTHYAGYGYNSLHQFPYKVNTLDSPFGFYTAGIVNETLALAVDKSYLETKYSLTLNGFKQYLSDNPTTLTYQLASEEIIPLQVSNPLTVFENGTIYVDPYLRETYNITGTTIALEYPIISIDKLVKIDGITETEIAGTLSSDGKTITVSSAGIYRVEGEIRPEESTQGQKIIQVPTNMKAQINSNVDGIRMLSKTVDEHSLALLTLSLRNL